MHHRQKLLLITHKHEGKYLQNSEVLQSSKVTLGDACEIISIQLPAKTDTQTYMNNSSRLPLDLFSLMTKSKQWHGCIFV